MLLEINHAATHILSWLKSSNLFSSSDDLSESFILNFSNLLTNRYIGHWDPNYPILGSGYRSISVYNGRLDSVLKQTALSLGFSVDMFATMLPQYFVLWVDPMEVSYRTGDYGYPSVIWRQSHNVAFRPKRASPLRTISLKRPDSPDQNLEEFQRGYMIWSIFILIASARLTPWFDICHVEQLRIPAKIEPSDLAFSNGNLYLVSDNGRFLIFNSDDTLSQEIKIDGKPDLEGVAADPNDPNILYLGVEYPASIIVYNLSSRSISKTLDLQSDFDNYSTGVGKENKGLESLAYYLSNNGKKYFLAGRQSDSMVFAFEYEKSLTFNRAFLPPGPGKDLSAITIWNDRIWFLYDKGKELTAVKLEDLELGAESEKKVLNHDKSVGRFSFNFRGLEGISFVNRNGTVWVYLAVDPPKKFGEKQLLKYSLRSFFACFNFVGSNAAFNLSLI